MNMLINHFIIASRAYSQQSPTCTRVNNLVYIFLDPTPMESHSCSLSADHVCSWKRLCPCSVLYSSCVLCKTSMSSNLTLLYHHMINLTSHGNSHHHMMNIIQFGYRVRFSIPFMPTQRMVSQKDLHIVCASGTHSILKTPFLKPNYYIYFNP